MFFQMDSTSGRYEDAPIGLGWQGPSRAYRKLEKLERDERFLEWLSNPLFERIARGTVHRWPRRAVPLHPVQQG